MAGYQFGPELRDGGQRWYACLFKGCNDGGVVGQLTRIEYV